MNGFLGKQQVQATIFWPSLIAISLLSPPFPSRNTDMKGKKKKKSQNLNVSEVKLKKKVLKNPQKALRLAF